MLMHLIQFIKVPLLSEDDKSVLSFLIVRTVNLLLVKTQHYENSSWRQLLMSPLIGQVDAS